MTGPPADGDMRIAIIQSCYIPWRGFFDLIGRCEQYVVFDSARFVNRHWHNRNRIKTARGLAWLTIPVVSKGRHAQPIEDVEIAGPWAERHWRSIELSYRRAPFFAQLAPLARSWYERADRERRLTDVNLLFLTEVARLLGVRTRIVRDAAYPAEGRKTERLVSIAQAAGATRYLSGPTARAYLDENVFAAAGIAVEWMSYDGYPEYPQLYRGFAPAVSVLDVIFNTGPEASRFLAGPVLHAA